MRLRPGAGVSLSDIMLLRCCMSGDFKESQFFFAGSNFGAERGEFFVLIAS